MFVQSKQTATHAHQKKQKKTGIYAFRKNRQILLIGHETMEFMKISASYAFKNCTYSCGQKGLDKTQFME